MGRETDFLDEAIRHQVYLEKFGTSVSRKVAAKATRIVPATVDLLLDLEENLTDLGSKALPNLHSLIAQAHEINTRLMLDAIDSMMPELAELASYEAGYTERALSAATRSVRLASLRAGEAFDAALAQPIPATGELLEALTEGWSKGEVKAAGDMIAKGYTNGLTNQQIVTSFRGTKALNYSDGIGPRIARNAEAVTRTSIQHVAGTARMETWARNSDVVEGYTIVATLDSRTSPICRSLDGKTFKLGKGPRPPLHIRCRSTTVPALSKEFDFLDEGATRSAEGGPVSADLTYYEWLKTQKQAFQDEAIGTTRAKLLRDGGLSADEFSRLNLGRNFEAMTLDEMRKREPGAFRKAGI